MFETNVGSVSDMLYVPGGITLGAPLDVPSWAPFSVTVRVPFWLKTTSIVGESAPRRAALCAAVATRSARAMHGTRTEARTSVERLPSSRLRLRDGSSVRKGFEGLGELLELVLAVPGDLDLTRCNTDVEPGEPGQACPDPGCERWVDRRLRARLGSR